MLVLPVDGSMLVAPAVWAPMYAKAFIALAVLSVALVCDGGRYRARLHLSVLDELPGLVGRLLVATALVAGVFVIRHDGVGVEPFLASALAAVPLVLLGRFATTWFLLYARRRRVVAHRTVLLGGGFLAAELIELLDRCPRYGLAVIGYVDDGEAGVASTRVAHIGTTAGLAEVVREHDVEVLITTAGNLDEEALLDRLRTPPVALCDLLVVPRLHAFRTQVGSGDHIGSVPLARVRTPALHGFSWTIKRLFDVVVSVLALSVLSPVMLICAVAVRIEGGPGVVFRQARVGRNGKVFECLKFRSMTPTSSVEADTRWSVAGDGRIGPVGRVLRRASLDELPQFWNILRGDMTVVGPRPERPYFVQRFSDEHPRYAHRHRVPAGLTGLAQVSGLRGDTPISDRTRFDNYYIENWSLWLDAKVLLRTVGEMILARGK